MPLVSVIIPAYRVTPYISETLDSVLGQTFQDFEIIVINDGCPDTERLERVLQPYFPRIHYMRQANGGPGGARNAGLSAARGEYIAFLDGDDQWLPEYLATQVAYLREHPEVDVVYADAEIFGDDESRGVGKRFMDQCPSTGEVTLESLLTERCVVFISSLCRRSAIDRAGGFDAKLRGVEDFDLWLRIVRTGGRIAYHRHVLSRYRAHSSSLSANRLRMSDGHLLVVDKLEQQGTLTDREKQAAAQFRRKITANNNLATGRLYLRDGDAHAARQALANANTYFRSAKIGSVVLLLRLIPAAVWFWRSRPNDADDSQPAAPHRTPSVKADL
jgi:glycosyltransferase involved in cell wall biosynthesis